MPGRGLVTGLLGPSNHDPTFISSFHNFGPGPLIASLPRYSQPFSATRTQLQFIVAPLPTWSDTEDVILFRAMVQALLASRSTLYAEPGLQPWSPNGASKINVKIQQLLKRFEGTVPGAAEVVKKEVGALSNKKNTPLKPKSAATKTKERKVVKGEDDESQVGFSEGY